MLTTNANQEPMLQVKIEGKSTSMLVDTGAVHTCVNSNYASHLPMSGKFIKTIGFSGQMQLIPMTAPVCLQTKNKSVTIPILVSNQTPVNLFGRDALCKLGLQIWCSPDGVYIDMQGLETQMIIISEPTANVYCIGQIEEDVRQIVDEWGKFIEAQIHEARLPKTEFHCTMIYDPEKDTEKEKNWQEKTKGQKIEITSDYIIVGKQGAAMNITENYFIKNWFNVPNSVPHVSLYIGKYWETKDLGTMMKKAKQFQWEATMNPLIFHSKDKDYIKILCNTTLTGVPQEVLVNHKIPVQMTIPKIQQVSNSELFKDMESQVPPELWSQHDTDVGIVKSANPIIVRLKPGVGLPRKWQYPIRSEAETGIKNTIDGLVKASC